MTDATAAAADAPAAGGASTEGTAGFGTAGVDTPGVGTAADVTSTSEGGRFVFLTENATAEEVGAVTAVLQGALDELADDAVVQSPAVSAWQRSQRAVRGPLTRGAGAWRSFSG